MSKIQRVAVVTGGAGGIGAACAERLARDGLDIVVIDVKPADAVLATIRATGRRAEAVRADITDPAETDRLHAFVAEAFGRCDVLLNNAGFYSFVHFNDLTYETWRRYMGLNLDGTFLMSKAFVPLMRLSGGGRIINLASNSLYAMVPGLTAYIATKGGVVGLTRGMASDLGADNITVNAVAPGPTVTEQVRSGFAGADGTIDETAFGAFLATIVQTQAIKRPGMPDDVAGVVSFFASEDSRFVTGQTVVIDGGAMRH